jgi:hypothetical protein
MRSLPQQWIEAKEAEVQAIAQRRAIEDMMLKAGLREAKGYRIRIAERDNWKIDSDKLQTLAEAHGLSDHLSTLFRWRPEVDMRQWRSADGKITKPLLPAITITPGRPSFTITKED